MDNDIMTILRGQYMQVLDEHKRLGDGCSCGSTATAWTDHVAYVLSQTFPPAQLTMTVYDARIDELEREMAAWVDGRNTWAHSIEAPDIAAVMNAQEVVARAAAIQAYVAMRSAK